MLVSSFGEVPRNGSKPKPTMNSHTKVSANQLFIKRVCIGVEDRTFRLGFSALLANIGVTAILVRAAFLQSGSALYVIGGLSCAVALVIAIVALNESEE